MNIPEWPSSLRDMARWHRLPLGCNTALADTVALCAASFPSRSDRSVLVRLRHTVSTYLPAGTLARLHLGTAHTTTFICLSVPRGALRHTLFGR